MGDLFISYARPDEAAAERAASALTKAGFDVWRDSQLPAHRTYADVIEERLADAKAVLVLWSKSAVKSQWVRAEADFARNAGTLVQASVDGTMPPIPFNQIRVADLSIWSGLEENDGWNIILESVSGLIGLEQQRPSLSNRPAEGLLICVLPFENMSGDPEQEYFSDGISEDVTTDLSKVSALSVIARNTAFQFKGKAIDIGEVARQLGVSHVLEGSVRKSGNRVRITAQLIDGKSGGHIWAERYDRDLTDIFAIQDEISEAIVDALKVRLLPEEKRALKQRGTESAEAYNLFLMARNQEYRGNHGDPRREERIIKLCEFALDIDANYAQALALKAIAQSTLHYGFGRPGDDGVDAAAKALAIDPTIAEAYCPIARRLTEHQRFGEAEAQIAAALQLDPDSWEVNKEGLRVHSRQRNFREAAAHIQKCLSVMENDYYSWGLLVTCLHALGDTASVRPAAEMALVQAEEAIVEDANNGGALSVGARALIILGDTDRADDWAQRALATDPDNLNVQYNVGAARAAHLGDRDGAIALIGPALEKASGTLITWAAIDPDIDSIRDDPRFQSALAAAEARVSARSTRPLKDD